MGHNGKLIGIAVAVVIVLLVIQSIVISETKETVTATVIKTERVVTGSGDSMVSKYLVYTDREVFQNTDELIVGKWNSSDIYSRLENGKTYRFVVYGYRVPYLSMYRNIISVDESRPAGE